VLLVFFSFFFFFFFFFVQSGPLIVILLYGGERFIFPKDLLFSMEPKARNRCLLGKIT
jgi:hypothetical protein